MNIISPTINVSQLLEILPIPNNSRNQSARAKTYDVFALKTVLTADWPQRPDYAPRKKSWSEMKVPFYATVNTANPDGEPSAQVGLCIIVNCRGGLVKQVRAIVRKHIPQANPKATVNFWFKKGKVNPNDVSSFVKILEAIENDLRLAGLV